MHAHQYQNTLTEWSFRILDSLRPATFYIYGTLYILYMCGSLSKKSGNQDIRYVCYVAQKNRLYTYVSILIGKTIKIEIHNSMIFYPIDTKASVEMPASENHIN